MIFLNVLMIIFALIITTYYVFIYGIGILINLYGKRFDVKRTHQFQPRVSVVMSCFNEGEAVYQTIKSIRLSDYPIEKLEIIGVDDCSKDNSVFWMLKAAEEFPGVTIKQNTTNQGKAKNILSAVEISQGDIIVSIDSDCIFEPNAIKELMSSFTHANIAAVGGRIGISNANVNWLTRFQTIAYAFSFLVMKAPEKICRKIQCLSGPLVAIRRECFNEIKKEIEQRNFLGVKITNGEDRALTQMLLMHGYDTYLNTDAVCYTNVPTTLVQYSKQQLRWRRSGVGQYFQAIFNLPKMVFKSGVISTLFSIMPIFILLAWNALAVTAWMAGKIHIVLLSIVLTHFTMGPIVVFGFYYYARHSTHTDLKTISLFDLLFCRIFGAFWYPISAIVITLFALYTLDDGGWVTREANVKPSNMEN